MTSKSKLPPTPRNVFTEVLWPRGSFKKVANLAVGFNLYSMIWKASGGAPTGVLQTVFELYDEKLAMVTRPFQFMSDPIVLLIGSVVGQPLQLEWQWKYLLCLLLVYFARDVQNAWSKGAEVSAMFHAVLGLLVALIASAVAGSIELVPSDFWSNFGVASVPVLGLLCYSLIGRAWGATFERNAVYDARLSALTEPTFAQAFWPRAWRAIGRSVVLIGITAFLLQPTVMGALPGAGVMVFAVSVFLLGLYWMVEGLVDVQYSRTEGETWLEAYSKGNSAIVGASMINVFLQSLICALLDVLSVAASA
jgi:hypothetical protein